MGAHLIFFILFTLFSCIILNNQSLPWYSLRSGFQCDTNMAAVFSCMRPNPLPVLLSPGARGVYLPMASIQCFINGSIVAESPYFKSARCQAVPFRKFIAFDIIYNQLSHCFSRLSAELRKFQFESLILSWNNETS